MNHPHELLAEYVDGALPEGERTVVEDHLRGCPDCRADEGVARSARRALTTLSDGPVPADLTTPALGQASRDHRAASGTPGWYRLAGLAAAASLVILFAVALPRLGSQNADEDASLESIAAETGAAPSAPGNLRLESRDANYDEVALGQLAADDRTAGLTAGATDTAFDTQRGTEEVIDCLRAAFPGLEGRPVQLIRARFSGTEAFIGVFRTAAGGQGDPASQVALAVSVRRCLLLSFASASI